MLTIGIQMETINKQPKKVTNFESHELVIKMSTPLSLRNIKHVPCCYHVVDA